MSPFASKLPNELQQKILLDATPPCLLTKKAMKIIHDKGDIASLSARDRSHIQIYLLRFGFVNKNLEEQLVEARKSWIAMATDKAMGIKVYNAHLTRVHEEGAAVDEKHTIMLDVAESWYFHFKQANPLRRLPNVGSGPPEGHALRAIIHAKPVYMTDEKWMAFKSAVNSRPDVMDAVWNAMISYLPSWVERIIIVEPACFGNTYPDALISRLVTKILAENKGSRVVLERNVAVGHSVPEDTYNQGKRHVDKFRYRTKTRIIEVCKATLSGYIRTSGMWDKPETPGADLDMIWYP